MCCVDFLNCHISQLLVLITRWHSCYHNTCCFLLGRRLCVLHISSSNCIFIQCSLLTTYINLNGHWISPKVNHSLILRILICDLHSSYLPGVEVNHDHEGGSSRVRPFHCTSVGLTPTITPNVGNSNALFLLVVDCVRAIHLLNWIPFWNIKILVSLTCRMGSVYVSLGEGLDNAPIVQRSVPTSILNYRTLLLFPEGRPLE